MDVEAIREKLTKGLGAQRVELESDGNRLSVRIWSPEFEGLSRVKRQQKVYALLDDRIKSGEIHAVTMITLTPEEN